MTKTPSFGLQVFEKIMKPLEMRLDTLAAALGQHPGETDTLLRCGRPSIDMLERLADVLRRPHSFYYLRLREEWKDVPPVPTALELQDWDLAYWKAPEQNRQALLSLPKEFYPKPVVDHGIRIGFWQEDSPVNKKLLVRFLFDTQKFTTKALYQTFRISKNPTQNKDWKIWAGNLLKGWGFVAQKKRLGEKDQKGYVWQWNPLGLVPTGGRPALITLETIARPPGMYGRFNMEKFFQQHWIDRGGVRPKKMEKEEQEWYEQFARAGGNAKIINGRGDFIHRKWWKQGFTGTLHESLEPEVVKVVRLPGLR